jgi:hypothetical protein
VVVGVALGVAVAISIGVAVAVETGVGVAGVVVALAVGISVAAGVGVLVVVGVGVDVGLRADVGVGVGVIATTRCKTGRSLAVAFCDEEYVAPLELALPSARDTRPALSRNADVTSTLTSAPTVTAPMEAMGLVKAGT